MKRYLPQQVIDRYREIFGSTTEEDFFRNPRHKKTQELWCAGHFALAYNRYIAPCAVWISDVDTQQNADFELERDGQRLPFQITEVIEPGRRRGDEYRPEAPKGSRQEDWSRGTKEGPSWVRAAIEKKALKSYAGSDTLNLLCYVNYGAWEQEFTVIRRECADVSSKFASVWLLNGNALCCIQPFLPAFPGWLQIPETMNRI